MKNIHSIIALGSIANADSKKETLTDSILKLTSESKEKSTQTRGITIKSAISSEFETSPYVKSKSKVPSTPSIKNTILSCNTNWKKHG